MAKLLLVEDDENLGHSLEGFLKEEGHHVLWAKKISEAREKYDQEVELIVLDWMLPDGQGIDLIRDLRARSVHCPVIMLTARTEVIDKVVGLESGANDYITKPFEPRELAARIRVQMRDHQNSHQDTSQESDKIILGDLVIDLRQREVSYKEELKDFTKMEFDFLHLLAENPNRAFSREEILNKVWGYENYPTTRTVDTHVLQIRQKLYDELIETVRGVGYRLRFKES